MGKSDEELEEYDTVTLTLEDDTVLECGVTAIYPVGEQQYIALLPLDDNGDVADDAEVLLYRFKELEDGEIEITNIEEDDEYEAAADAFDELLDEEAFSDEFEDDEK